MILFSWTLTPNQVLALRSVADYQAAYERLAQTKDRAAIEALRLNALDMPHWISTTRLLLRENFIRHVTVPLAKWEMTETKRAHNITTRPAWEITEKGKLILQIVAIEVEEQAKVLANDRKVLKLLVA